MTEAEKKMHIKRCKLLKMKLFAANVIIYLVSQQCVLFSCLSPQFVCYLLFSSSYGPRLTRFEWQYAPLFGAGDTDDDLV